MTPILLVPENTDVCLLEELDNIKKWADINRMHLNLAKTEEIVFCTPRPHLELIPPLLDFIERVEEAKLLRVFFHYNLNSKLMLLLF